MAAQLAIRLDILELFRIRRSLRILTHFSLVLVHISVLEENFLMRPPNLELFVCAAAFHRDFRHPAPNKP